MMKEIFLLQGFTKLDQLVSSVTYSPLWARNRRGEKSKGCPLDCTTSEGRQSSGHTEGNQESQEEKDRARRPRARSVGEVRAADTCLTHCVLFCFTSQQGAISGNGVTSL